MLPPIGIKLKLDTDVQNMAINLNALDEELLDLLQYAFHDMLLAHKLGQFCLYILDSIHNLVINYTRGLIISKPR